MVLKSTGLDISAIEQFIIGIERQSLLLAKFSLKNNVDAVELVEAVVVAWVKKSADMPPAYWRKSFFSHLMAAIVQFLRRPLTRAQWIQSRSELQFYESIQQQDSEAMPSITVVLNAIAHLPLPLMLTFLLSDWLSFSEQEVADILAEPTSTIQSRLASVRMGLLNTLREKTPLIAAMEEVPLLQSSLRGLDQACTDTDYIELHQLRAIRHLALREAENTSTKAWLLLSVMVVCLFIFWWLNLPRDMERPLSFYSGESLLDALPQAWQEDAELLENLAFYQWLTTAVVIDASTVKVGDRKEFDHTQWRQFPDQQKVAILSNYQEFLRLPHEQQQAIHTAYYYFWSLSAKAQNELKTRWQAALKIGNAP